ncbi:MAG: hypothetical protein GTO63_15765 [Anaerolineae bacterium]|nr:hypothetical protein [Anaerolineae bacterium]NIN96286.1 hypothetical protein [Anaerolineae bacterium]NIQ79306.1 hypothetical protein [Anaerolineae bacterium]
MIRKVGEGFVIYSEKGKKLSKKYATRKAAERRLRQIEYFKHKGSAEQQKKAFI